MRGRVAVDEAFLRAVPVEPADRRQSTTDRGPGFALGFAPAGIQLDVGTFDVEGVEPGGIEPADPLPQVEPVGLQRCAGVSSEEARDCLLDSLPDRVDIDENELSDGCAAMIGGVREILLVIDGELSRSPQRTRIKVT